MQGNAQTDMSIEQIIVLIVSFLISWAGSVGMRRYALSRAMLDMPNARSSHVVPTPRGGGVAFVFSFLAGLLILNLSGSSELPYSFALAAGGFIVALVGFLDDRGGLSRARTKLFWHFVAAAVVLVALSEDWLSPVGKGSAHLNIFGYSLGLIVLVWSINLYNFMDGIDGLAISEAIFLALGSALIIGVAGGDEIEALLLAVVCMGFAFFNWPPAKLFMGDAGSGFLGLIYAVIALHANLTLQTTLWPWLILPGVFIVDTTFTLLRRMLTRQRWYQAHCSHAYQRAAKRFRSHRRVTVSVLMINVFWLLPLAGIAQLRSTEGPFYLLIAWAPLFFLEVYFGAGNVPSSASRSEIGGAVESQV
jgi:Fuc2NAc and GlcNAc transferase